MKQSSLCCFQTAGWFLYQLPGRIADHSGVIRYIFNDHGACTNDHIIADRDSLAYDGVSANKTASSHFYIAAQNCAGGYKWKIPDDTFVVDAAGSVADNAITDFYHGV